MTWCNSWDAPKCNSRLRRRIRIWKDADRCKLWSHCARTCWHIVRKCPGGRRDVVSTRDSGVSEYKHDLEDPYSEKERHSKAEKTRIHATQHW